MSLTANVYLEINNVTKKGRIVDASNYSANSINLAALSAKGLGVVTSPTGVAIYSGTTVGSPLVNLASTNVSAWFDLPLDTTGAVLNGTYSFTYNLRYAITAGVIDAVAATSTFTLEFTNAGRVLIAGDSLVTTGNAQAANNGTFTVSTAAYNVGSDNSTIVVTQTSLVNEASPTGTYSFDVTRTAFAGSTVTFNGCDFVTQSVVTTSDCDSTQYGQLIVQDTTNYGTQTLVSRTLFVYYPNGLTPAPATDPVTTTENSVTINELATGTWTYNLTSNVSVTQDDGLVYTYTKTTGATEFVVTCIGTLCGLTPCIESIKDKFAASYVKGVPSGLEPTILYILQLYALAVEYKKCNNAEMYASTVAQLESVLDESGECSCGCCDETSGPQWIDNAGFDSQNVLTDLYDQVQALAATTTYGETVIFQSPQFYGLDNSFNNPPLSFTNISAITIPASYLDYPSVDGAFGSKFITIDLKAETGSTGAQARVTLVDGDVALYSRTFGAANEDVELTTKLILRTQKVGVNTLVWVLQNTTFNNRTLETMESESLNPTFTNILASGDDLVLNFTPVAVGAAAKTSYTHLKITASKSLI